MERLLQLLKSLVETRGIYNMNYFERCKKRIENARVIDGSISNTFNLLARYSIDQQLVLKRFSSPDKSDFYTITFMESRVPLSGDEMKYLFELSEKKLAELASIEDEKVLRDL